MLTKHFTDYPGAHHRSVHLIDIENLLGGPTFTSADAARLEVEYRRVAALAAGDHVIVACSHFAAPAAWFGWGRGRRLIRSGPDGADLALLGVLEGEGVASRFDRVVVASGDGIFAEACARLQGEGREVTVVSRGQDSLSLELAFAVRDTRFLAQDALPGAAAALRLAA